MVSHRKSVRILLPLPEPPRIETLTLGTPVPKPKGMLSVNVIPGNVRVYIDGQLWKKSIPFETPLPVGPHKITIEEPGAPASARITRNIIIKADDHTEIVERL